MKKLIFVLVFLLLPLLSYGQQFRSMRSPSGVTGDVVVTEGMHYDIRAYGAVADDGIDDKAAIQAAIDAAELVKGVVFLPPGTYLCTSGLTVDSQCTIRGAGRDATTLKKSGNIVGITINATHVVLTDFRLEATGTDSSNGITITKNPRGVLSRLYIDGHGNHGIELIEGNNSTFEDLCIVNNGGDGFKHNSNISPGANACLVGNIDARSNTGWGYNLHVGKGNFILGVVCQFNTAGGIRVNDRSNWMVLYSEANTGDAIEIANGVPSATFTGSGLDDLTTGGASTGDLSYRVQIDSEGGGTGGVDTFKWSDDGGSTWDATGVDITGGAQSLSKGVTVTFGATTGHTLDDRWDFTCTQPMGNMISYVEQHLQDNSPGGNLVIRHKHGAVYDANIIQPMLYNGFIVWNDDYEGKLTMKHEADRIFTYEATGSAVNQVVTWQNATGGKVINMNLDGEMKVGALRLLDTDASHYLRLVWNEDDSATRYMGLKAHGGNRTLDLYESLTIGNGNDGTITFSGASKTLTVEDDAQVSQDVTSDASPQFAGLTLTGDISGAGGFKEQFSFMQSNVAASQTDVQIDCLGLSGNTEFVMAYAGSVIAISIASNAARSAGAITNVEPTINGAGTGLVCELDDSPTQYNQATQAKDTDAFSAGDRLGVEITTDGSWAPTTADIVVTVIVEM